MKKSAKRIKEKRASLSKLLGCTSLTMAFVFLMFGCDEVNTKARTAKNIEQSVRKGAGTILAIKDLNEKEWDQLIIFEAYTPRSTIIERVGNDFLKKNEIHMSVGEGYNFLVFLKEGCVVEYFTYPRWKGDFFITNRIASFTPKEAIFYVVDTFKGLDGPFLLTKALFENENH